MVDFGDTLANLQYENSFEPDYDDEEEKELDPWEMADREHDEEMIEDGEQTIFLKRKDIRNGYI